jgi:hypothetical protein
MRDFRNAKAMARTLRASLAAKSIKISVSQSLELVSEMLGVADWNTLAAIIRTEMSVSRERASIAVRLLAKTIQFCLFLPILQPRGSGPFALPPSGTINTRR